MSPKGCTVSATWAVRTGHIRFAILRERRLYFASPLFSSPERSWNAEVAAALRAAGHEVFLPQEQEPGKDGAGIFATDVGEIDWADGLVPTADGPDPDSGTSWEVGYAFRKKPIVLVLDRLPRVRRTIRGLQPDADRGCDDPARSPEDHIGRGGRNDHRGSRAPRDDLACQAVRAIGRAAVLPLFRLTAHSVGLSEDVSGLFPRWSGAGSPSGRGGSARGCLSRLR